MADLAHQNVTGAHPGETRRDFLILTATAIGGVGVAAAIWPFIGSLNPARDTLALSTTEVDLAPVPRGGFVFPRPGQDRKLKCPRTEAGVRTQRRHEGWDLSIG